jgi:hypothetical protein
MMMAYDGCVWTPYYPLGTSKYQKETCMERVHQNPVVKKPREKINRWLRKKYRSSWKNISK